MPQSSRQLFLLVNCKRWNENTPDILCALKVVIEVLYLETPVILEPEKKNMDENIISKGIFRKKTFLKML